MYEKVLFTKFYKDYGITWPVTIYMNNDTQFENPNLREDEIMGPTCPIINEDD